MDKMQYNWTLLTNHHSIMMESPWLYLVTMKLVYFRDQLVIYVLDFFWLLELDWKCDKSIGVQAKTEASFFFMSWVLGWKDSHCTACTHMEYFLIFFFILACVVHEKWLYQLYIFFSLKCLHIKLNQFTASKNISKALTFWRLSESDLSIHYGIVWKIKSLHDILRRHRSMSCTRYVHVVIVHARREHTDNELR